ncbi:MAG: hypothetical protein H6739_39820 [Alphaproteobacteria bacterium]|nr:hypothetical protein [Alphaproteobacteria bacterium]
MPSRHPHAASLAALLFLCNVSLAGVVLGDPEPASLWFESALGETRIVSLQGELVLTPCVAGEAALRLPLAAGSTDAVSFAAPPPCGVEVALEEGALDLDLGLLILRVDLPAQQLALHPGAAEGAVTLRVAIGDQLRSAAVWY